MQASSIEIGPAVLMPDGRVFCVGATGHTALYTPSGDSTGTAKYLLADHYFGGFSGNLWTYDGTTWRAAGTAQPSDEQGIAQVTFAANRVDMWWDAHDSVTVLRAWKYP